MNQNLFARLRARFPRDPASPLLRLADGSRLAYADLLAATGRLARLLGDLGAGPGERVAVQVEKSPEALLLYLACLRAGAIFLPLNTAYTDDEIAYFLADAEPRALVVDPAREQAAQALAREAGVAHLLTLDADGEGTVSERSRALDPDAPVAAREADDVAAILYTSGTTGRPKGAMITHRNLASNAEVLHRAWAFRPDDVLLHALPVFHVHGLFVATHTILWAGGEMIFLPRFDAARVVELLPGASVFMGVPTHYGRLLAEPGLGPGACRGMRLFVSGSAPLLVETFERFRERTGHTILERYGMTEVQMACSNPYEGARQPGTVGPPLPGVEARVCDRAGNLLPAGEIGVLELRGPNVFKGYWRQPEKTREDFRDDGFFITGDLALIDDQGYVHIVGRDKDLIISGGYNVYPKEVESVLDRQDGVEESAVFGVPHPDFGEAVVAAVKRRAGGSGPDEAALIAAARRSLAAYKAPKAIVFLDELPRNTMGKLQKAALRERHQDLFAASSPGR